VNVIPAIDLRDGRCIRLYQGKFDRQTTYEKDPVALAREYEKIGFGYLHIVDLDGARSGQQQNESVVRQIASVNKSTIQLGGGIRKAAQIESWLSRGISRVIIGSVAIAEAARVRDWLSSYDPERIVLALDVTVNSDGIPWLATHGWTRQAGMTLWQCIDTYIPAGLQHILCTDISRDGALTGPNLDLYAQINERYPELKLQAAGGVRNIEDLRALQDIDVHAAISGRALLDGKITTGEIQTFLRAA
jgi:phosphoribosylformimino-5-aminoimidazole carboxamide ribotide isomerase